MIPVRSLEQLSCLMRWVTEAERSSSIEKRTPHMLISIFGTGRSPAESYQGCRADGLASPSCIRLTIHGHPYQGGAERFHAKSRHRFQASLVCSRAS
jgi:hypothetical protein